MKFLSGVLFRKRKRRSLSDNCEHEYAVNTDLSKSNRGKLARLMKGVHSFFFKSSEQESTVSQNLMAFKVIEANSCTDDHHLFSNRSDRCTTCNPIARSGHRMFCDEGYIYVLGGFNPEWRPGSSLIKDIWALNKYTEEWTKVRTDGVFPDEMASFSIAQNKARNCTFVFGGTGVPFGRRASNTMHALVRGETFDHWTWKEIETFGKCPIPVYGQSMHYVEGEGIYIIGGTTGFEYNMHVYKLKQPLPGRVTPEMLSMQWEWSHEYESKNAEDGRYRHEMVQTKEGFLIVGGGTPSNSLTLESLMMYNVNEKNYTLTRTFPDKQFGYPSPRRCHIIVHNRDHVYIMGGCRDTFIPLVDAPDLGNVQLKPLSDVWTLNLTTYQWEKRPITMNRPLYFHAGALTDEECLYTFGGCFDQGTHARSDKLEKLWLQPPPLLHMMFMEYAKKTPKTYKRYGPTRLRHNFSSLLVDCMDIERTRRKKVAALKSK